MKFEYCVAESFELPALTNKVEGLISDGWVPIGGVASTGATGWYMQAMTRQTAIIEEKS